MKAVVYAGKQQVEIRDISKPRPSAGEVLIKIRSVGICGTDLHIYNGGTDVKPGTVIGHEFSGEVAALGPNVTGLKVGARVVGEHVLSCGRCYYCVRGKPNLCLKAEIYGLNRQGGLAEYLVLPARLVYEIPKHMSFDEGALVEPLTIALYAAAQAGFLLEQRVAVVGQGPIGLLLDQVLEAAGAHVIGIDVIPERLKFALRQRWAHEVLNPKSKNFQTALSKISSVGVDTSFEAVGKEQTAELCFDITRRDGHVFLLGVFEKPATLNLMQVIKKELNVHGSWTCAFSFPAAIDMIAEKKVNLRSLITHRYNYKDAGKAFAEASVYSQNRIKTVIQFP